MTELRRRRSRPTQADKLERGPVRLRTALQFSLNIPAIKAGHHQRPRPRLRADEGLRPDATRRTAIPVAVDGHRHARGPPDRPARRVRHDRQRRRPDAAPGHHHDRRRTTGSTVWPLPNGGTQGRRGSSAPSAAYIITDILAGNTDQEDQPVLGQVGDLRRQDRAARPPTRPGTTSDNRDVAAYGYLAPPADPKAPALAVGVWMGNSDNTPNDGKLSLDTSAPLWSAILTEVSKGDADRGLQAAERTSRPPPSTRSPGSSPARSRRKTVKELLPAGHGPDPEGDDPGRGRRSTRRAACSGRTAAPGPKVTKGVLRPVRGRSRTSRPGRRPNANWAARAAQGLGRPRRPEGHPHVVLLQRGVRAVRADLGRAVRARQDRLPAVRRRRRTAIRSRPDRDPARRRRRLHPAPDRPAVDGAEPGPHPDPADAGDLRSRLRARRSSPRRRPRRARPGGATVTSGWLAGRRAGRRRGAAPVPRPWMIDDLVEAGQRGVVEVADEGLERLVDAGAAQVERRGHRAGPLEPELRGVRGGSRARAPFRPRSDASSPSAGTRSSTSTVTRIPPASSVARRPPRSSAAIRPSQPPDRLRARSPSRHGALDGRLAAAGAVLGGRAGARGRASARATRVVEHRRRDGLALERLAGRATSSRRSSTIRSASSRAARTASSRSRRARRRSSSAARSASAARSSAARARSSASLVSPSVARIEASVASNERCDSVSRERASADDRARAGRAARRWRTPGCRPAGRSSGGRSATSVSRSNSTAALRAPGVVWA